MHVQITFSPLALLGPHLSRSIPAGGQLGRNHSPWTTQPPLARPLDTQSFLVVKSLACLA